MTQVTLRGRVSTIIDGSDYEDGRRRVQIRIYELDEEKWDRGSIIIKNQTFTLGQELTIRLEEK